MADENSGLWFVMIILIVMFVTLITYASIEDSKVDAVCEALGWETGNWYFFDVSECVQTIACEVDEVIAGNCKPIEVY